MVRKLTALATAVVVAVAMLPALAALAADGSAVLNSARNLFHKAEATGFQITVTNTEQASGGVLTIGQTPAARVNFIDVLLPSNLSGVTCALSSAAAQNWNCNDNNFPGAQQILRLSVKQGAQGLAGGASLPINFTALTKAPAGISRTDSFVVRTATTSNDYEVTTGNLSQTIHGLELGNVITIDDLGRTGEFNAVEFTSGQLLRATFTVTNRSSVPITVTPSMDAGALNKTLIATGNAGDFDPANPVVPAGATQRVVYQINTAGQSVNQVVQQLSASASGTSTVDNTNTAKSGPAVRIISGATQPVTDIATIVIDAPANLRFGNNARDTVLVGNNDQRTNLVPAEPTTITIDAIKSQIPRVFLDAYNGNATTPAGSFIRLTVANCPVTTCPTVIGGLASVNDGARELARSGTGNDQTVKLEYNVDLTPFAAVSAGNLLDLDAQFLFAGQDDNIFPFAKDLSLEDLLRIDALAPILRLNPPQGSILRNGDPALRDRVKDGDVVTISGSVTHTGDLADLEVRLSSSQAPSAGGAPYSQVVVTEGNLGTSTPNGDGTVTQTFSVPVTLPGTANNTAGQDTYALGFGGFAALSQQGYADDTATNRGIALPADPANPRMTLDLDNNHPDITPTAPFTVGGQQVARPLGYYIQNNAYGSSSVIRVTWDAGLFLDTVVGGCANNMWEVDGVEVDNVLFYDGSECVAGQKPPTFDPTTAPLGSNVNDRILVLSGPINPATQTVNFSFVPDGGDLGFILGTDHITDDIRNRAYQQDGIVIDGRIPNLPSIINNLVLRGNRDTSGEASNGFEPVGVSAAQDPNGQAFSLLHSNAPELQIPVTNFIGGTDDLQIVEILDPAAFASSIDPPASSYRVISRQQSSANQTQFDLTNTDIQFQSCGADCQTRNPRAFRFIRRATTTGGSQYDINGPFLRVDFLYDSQRLTPSGTTLTMGGAQDGDDVVTVAFGGDGSGLSANDGNTIARFYGSQTEWNAQRTLGGPDSTEYATHQAQTVTQQVNDVRVEIDYGTNDTADYYAMDYFKFDFDQKIEDLAGNVVQPYYRLFPNGTMEVFSF